MSIKYMSTILDVDAFTCTQKIILLCIADYANDEGVAWPGKSAIAKKCRVSPTTVKNQLKKLSEMGVISIRRRKTEESKIHDTNVYWINLKAIINLEPTSGNDDPRANSALGHLTPEGRATAGPKPSLDPSDNNRSPLNPPKGDSEGSETPRKSSRKTPMPDAFQVTKSMQDWYAQQEGFVLSVQAATEQWIDAMKARGATYVDWVSAWRNGMRLQNKWSAERGGQTRKLSNIAPVEEYSEQTNPDDYAPPQWFQDRESGGEQ
ncbi:helix-turn-helix domain-containing protein [Vibrio coralliilyticus]|uniref:helix-turn-helix domain-containing protein n=1 Tax=Vibrio coralliilyticus TaxID=190893 RepID=UPI001E3ACE80|nr:helix-turn-helix domain-containing protein [Vibrio coralliilyticus]MCC2521054.1 helix-turn-helix domain-containing protein [Vibrio coralliilyticus]